MSYAIHVEAARGHVGRNDDIYLTCFEPGDGSFA
jgi:hypothetical protein